MEGSSRSIFCVEDFRNLYKREKDFFKFGWGEHKNHLSDGYLYTIDVSGYNTKNKKRNVCSNLTPAGRLLGHGRTLPVPVNFLQTCYSPVPNWIKVKLG